MERIEESTDTVYTTTNTGAAGFPIHSTAQCNSSNNETILKIGEQQKPSGGGESWLNRTFDSVNTIIGTLGVIVNLLACVVFLGHRPLRQRIPNYFLVNQCFIDLLIGLMLFLNLTVFPDPTYLLAKQLVCLLWNSKVFFTGLFAASSLNLAILTLERYLEVVHPIVHKLSLSRRKVVASLAFSWLFGIGFKLIIVLPTTKIFNGGVCVYGIFPNDAAFRATVFSNFMVDFFVPIVVIAACYSLMVRAMRRSINPQPTANAAASSSSSGGGAVVVAAKIRRNILKTLFVIVVFMACTLPLKQALHFTAAFGHHLDYGGVLFQSSLVLTYVNCCVNPFIYLAKYAEFRRGLRRICSRVCRICVPNAALGKAEEQTTRRTLTVEASL